MVVFKYGLNVHRTAVPIDHPDRSVTRVKLEYPTVDVSFAYLDAINKLVEVQAPDWDETGSATVDVFVDKAIEGVISDQSMFISLRTDKTWNNRYSLIVDTGFSTRDFGIHKVVNKSYYIIAYEAVDLVTYSSHLAKLSISGSSIKGFRGDLSTPKITVTDTTFASGSAQIGAGWGRGTAHSLTYFLRAPASPSPQAISILEVGVEGSGSPDDPYRHVLSRNLVPISQLSGLPAFLYREAKKYEVLRAKGFTDEEMELLLGYVPKHQVDLDAVTWGAFELHPDKSPTAIVTVVGDNPYSQGAVERQRGVAKRWWSPPSGYNEAVELYMQLSRDFDWLAGKDNFAYQVLGWEELEWLQNVDFYYGELVEHRTHYSQLKQVSDDEIRGRIEELIGKLSSMGVLRGERESHIAKAKEVLRRGW